MKKFIAIEGLRGWLAWAVVLNHVAWATDVSAKGLGPFLRSIGGPSVYVFVILSGFVITHLLIEKHEAYGVYIFRRFMRIFPLFAVTCVIGYLCTPILSQAILRLPWADSTSSDWNSLFTELVHTQVAYFWSNFFAHLIMIHGVISDNILPQSQYAFNAPAWSLSLEWQFYLIAPLAVVAAKRASLTLITIGVVTALCIGYGFGAFGTFGQRSLLFASGPFFLVGISSRIAYPKLAGSLRNPAIVIALLSAQIPLGWDLAPYVIWGCVYATLISDQHNLDPINKKIMNFVSLALESPVALFMGARSYSIYLCHLSVIGFVLYALTFFFGDLSRAQAFLALLFAVVPLTFAASCALYVSVELPGIALGNLVSTRRATATERFQTDPERFDS